MWTWRTEILQEPYQERRNSNCTSWFLHSRTRHTISLEIGNSNHEAKVVTSLERKMTSILVTGERFNSTLNLKWKNSISSENALWTISRSYLISIEGGKRQTLLLRLFENLDTFIQIHTTGLQNPRVRYSENLRPRHYHHRWWCLSSSDTLFLARSSTSRGISSSFTSGTQRSLNTFL